MFSALKKLTASGRQDVASVAGSNPGAGGGTMPMAESLQKKFARGVQYNSKHSQFNSKHNSEI